jgi:hypothetical protein
VEVRAIISQTPGCPAPVAVIESILSDEPDDATGDGDGRTTQDIRDAEFGTEDMVFRLRAERSGSGGGRTYTVSYAVTCGAGPPATASGTIFVPQDREGVTEPVDLSVDPAPGGSVVSWPSLGDGYRYNVIRGHLAELVQTAEAIWLGDVTCVAAQLEASDTVGLEDAALPDPGSAFFYLVEYIDGLPSQYGTAQAIKPYTPGAGSCSTEAAGQMLFDE